MATSEYQAFAVSTSSGVAGRRPLPVLLMRGPRNAAEVAVLDSHISQECERIRSSWPDSVLRDRAVGPGASPWRVPCYCGDDTDNPAFIPLVAPVAFSEQEVSCDNE